jgi:hypothetical protein
MVGLPVHLVYHPQWFSDVLIFRFLKSPCGGEGHLRSILEKTMFEFVPLGRIATVNTDQLFAVLDFVRTGTKNDDSIYLLFKDNLLVPMKTEAEIMSHSREQANAYSSYLKTCISKTNWQVELAENLLRSNGGESVDKFSEVELVYKRRKIDDLR